MRKVWTLGIVFLISFISSTAAGAEPISSVEVSISDYTVTTIDNLDYVEIPEGEILVEEEGRPRVPYYIKSIDYAEGYMVQEVILKERSGLETATGLRLPVVILDPSPELPIEMMEGWYPEEEYGWRLWENPDGSTTLVIELYPFYYNPETTDVKFYKNYHFDIEYIFSNVEITALYPDKDIYSPGDEVTIDIRLNNSSEEQNVVVSVLIKQYGSDVIVAGLPLRSLKELVGNSSLTAEWDSSGTEEGYYYAEVTLSDTTGNTLNKKTAEILIEVSEESPQLTLYVIIGAIAIAAIVALFVVRRLRRRT